MSNLADFKDRCSYTAPKKLKEELLDREITILGYEEFDGTKGKYAIMLVADQGGEWTVSCGGQVLMKLLHKATEANAFPTKATLTRVKSKTGFFYIDLVG